jgi:F-type H+-transporting ATPase subunit epsilon
MANDLLVNIVSPSGSIFSGTASAVIAPGSIGEMTLLPKHAPLLSSLKQGKIKVMGTSNAQSAFEIISGFLEISNDKLTILVEDVL